MNDNLDTNAPSPEDPTADSRFEGLLKPERLYSTPLSQLASRIFKEIVEENRGQQQTVKR